MVFRVFQIDSDKDEKRVAFYGLEEALRWSETNTINRAIYNEVYEGVADCTSLEDLYRLLNVNHPKDYFARSLSVSDVIGVIGKDGEEFWYCDNFGFTKIEFSCCQNR